MIPHLIAQDFSSSEYTARPTHTRLRSINSISMKLRQGLAKMKEIQQPMLLPVLGETEFRFQHHHDHLCSTRLEMLREQFI